MNELSGFTLHDRHVLLFVESMQHIQPGRENKYVDLTQPCYEVNKSNIVPPYSITEQSKLVAIEVGSLSIDLHQMRNYRPRNLDSD